MVIQIKRVYDPCEDSDGFRVLVDRLWPRGISREKGRIDLWAKEIAPSNELRKWYGHEPEKWDRFREKYFVELEKNADRIAELLSAIQSYPTVTLLYSSKEKSINNAEALKLYLGDKLAAGRR